MIRRLHKGALGLWIKTSLNPRVSSRRGGQIRGELRFCPFHNAQLNGTTVRSTNYQCFTYIYTLCRVDGKEEKESSITSAGNLTSSHTVHGPYLYLTPSLIRTRMLQLDCWLVTGKIFRCLERLKKLDAVNSFHRVQIPSLHPQPLASFRLYPALMKEELTWTGNVRVVMVIRGTMRGFVRQLTHRWLWTYLKDSGY